MRGVPRSAPSARSTPRPSGAYAGEQSAGSIGVARDHRFHHLAQFADEVALAGRRAAASGRDSAFPGSAAFAARVPATGCRSSKPDRRKRNDAERRIAGRSAAVRPVRERRRARQLMERGDDARFPAHIARGDGVAQAELFDFDARRRQIAQIFRRDGRDSKAPLRARLHQALGGEPRERLADGALTRLELLAQLADAQRLTGFETAVEQRIAQLVVGTLRSGWLRCRRALRRDAASIDCWAK